jgi:hypothetical protein
MVNYLSTKRNQQQSVRTQVKAEHLQSCTTKHTTKHDFRWADPLYPSKHAHEYAQRLRCRDAAWREREDSPSPLRSQSMTQQSTTDPQRQPSEREYERSRQLRGREKTTALREEQCCSGQVPITEAETGSDNTIEGGTPWPEESGAQNYDSRVERGAERSAVNGARSSAVQLPCREI